MLDIGTLAPEFTLPRDGGSDMSLKDLAGRKVVLYFYPKDNTPGCTTEALDFTALKPKFDALNTIVIGISKDSVKKHDNFCKKHDLGNVRRLWRLAGKIHVRQDLYGNCAHHLPS